MKNLKVLGPGCPKCEELYRRTKEAVQTLSEDFQLEKVTDLKEIMSFGVMVTPALVVDGQVKVAGQVPRVEEIKKLIG
jgi:small redox-active disulfide protein 2